jgi:hypothetical protein
MAVRTANIMAARGTNFFYTAERCLLILSIAVADAIRTVCDYIRMSSNAGE